LEVIPVLDVCGGVAVHARGGDRAAYRPVRSILAEGADPLVLARAYRDRLGSRSCYLADLDAIAGTPPNLDLVRAVAGEGLSLWVDAGIADTRSARAVLAAGAARAVVALETLRNAEHLATIPAEMPADDLAFSLDLKDGRPVARSRELAGLEACDLAALAWEAGYATMILLDLARVGREEGPALTLVEALRSAVPDAHLAVGGGIRGPDDLERLARMGCAAALVGTAVHRRMISSRGS
jgi:phosphoribosylformimino-5-aminoimidazole carboxamide ribotide isomerase